MQDKNENKVYNMILNDQSVSHDLYNTSSLSESDFQHSKFISEHDLSELLKDILDRSNSSDNIDTQQTHKSNDAAYYKNKALELIKINYTFRNTISTIKQLLTLSIGMIHEKLDKQIDGFQTFNNYVEGNSLEETLNMAKFIPANLAKINKVNNKSDTVQLDAAKEKMQKLKTQILMLTKTNQNLVSYIQQRKKYSESLKSKIAKLKEQAKQSSILYEQNKRVLQNLDKFDTSQDIKYRNRNQLITMIKSLLTRIYKHIKQCDCKESCLNVDFLDKFFFKSTAMKAFDTLGKEEKKNSQQE